MSVIAVQAGVANYVIGTHPEEAARALTSIEQTSRGALRELRVLLEVLRTDEQDGPRHVPGDTLLPTPGLADLAGLVERTAEVGVRVNLHVSGERQRLPAGLDLAAYRVVQEAVTNVIKHADTRSCQVTVTYTRDALTVEIADHGTGALANGRGAQPVGHGIAGMRERVAVHGGRFQASPRAGGGFVVRAEFPLVTAAS